VVNHMKKITLHRPKESFNKNCSYEIQIGKKTLTELKNGEEKIIEIPNEFRDERLKAKIQWCGSEEMELRNLTENEKIIVSGNKFLNRKLPLFGAMFPLTGIMIFNTNNIISKNIGIGVLILFLIGLVGSLTIGKNKWLKLEKE
ncbi:hypothetical protein, partial [Joostella sp. CR20]|uniref:hypothetical protein n=1 Tax=Joostella sp. CR20 TaxID=2804312 RepID=UPI00313B08F4